MDIHVTYCMTFDCQIELKCRDYSTLEDLQIEKNLETIIFVLFGYFTSTYFVSFTFVYTFY